MGQKIKISDRLFPIFLEAIPEKWHSHREDEVFTMSSSALHNPQAFRLRGLS
jgi:hypothetical protein